MHGGSIPPISNFEKSAPLFAGRFFLLEMEKAPGELSAESKPV